MLPYITPKVRAAAGPGTAMPTADAFWALETTGDPEKIQDHKGTQHLTISSVLKVVEVPVSESYWQYNADTPSYATVADSDTLSMPDADFMWGAWVRLDSYEADTASRIVSKGVRANATTFEYALTTTGATPNRFAFSVGNGTNAPIVTDTNVSIVLGEWYFLVGRFDKSQQKIGINVNMSGWVETDFTGSPHADSHDLYVGIENPSSLRWNGAINMLFMEKSKLSDAQLNFWWRDGLGWKIPVLAS